MDFEDDETGLVQEVRIWVKETRGVDKGLTICANSRGDVRGEVGQVGENVSAVIRLRRTLLGQHSIAEDGSAGSYTNTEDC